MVRLRFATAFVLALVATAAPAYATYAGDNGKIAYEQRPPSGGGPSIATVNPDGSGHAVLTVGEDPAWSPDGGRLAFLASSAITVMNADGTGRRRVTQRAVLSDPTWSPDGEQIAFLWNAPNDSCDSLVATRVDGTETNLVLPDSTARCQMDDLEWSPVGDTILFGAVNSGSGSAPSQIFRVEADGSNLTQLTNETLPATDPDWSPDGSKFVYDVAEENQSGIENVVSMRPDGSDRTIVHTLGRDPVWAPDTGEIAFVDNNPQADPYGIVAVRTDHASTRTIYRDSLIKQNLDWQRLVPGPRGYPRPKAASPVDVSLVPTYYPCEEPNREHGPPLAFGSCNPPVPGSNYLTVGTPDANGQPSAFRGRLSYTTLTGNPGTAADEADVQLSASLSDVRCRAAGVPCTGGALSDYTGELLALFMVRITDKHNALGHSITMQDVLLTATIPCSVTPSSALGSDCSAATTLDAIVPGIVPEGKRSNWQLDQVTVYDGGANGDGSSPRGAFARAGIFVP